MSRAQDPVTVWCVLVEETIGRGEGQRWAAEEVGSYNTRDEALSAAERVTREYQPQHPAFEKGRKVYELGEGSWMVRLRGATMDFHFRVTVGKHVTGQGAPDDAHE
ncbi:hypothetical protein [Kibdelosporangium phytohabitans]|uniref:Uncharacterized protein n=1 Tax=Kibdelosporangium phytohabitans TaxID=860235 RepID=A0A0N9HUU9_9PSEU|nr:hypothetical protein [Kibdelosporangium phytohabitans]ALG06685.1 hypothetical protein AOZ06_06870 [Kibdelosporangium phytohabitans]MBE1467902.1 hypothetical protein [Kibdelosporangium phytohabitans]